MKSLRIVQNGFQHHAARSRHGDSTRKRLTVVLGAAVVIVGVVVFQGGVVVDAALPPDSDAKGRPPQNVPHTLEITGDIQAYLEGVNLKADNPLGKLELDGFEVTFPAGTAGVGCCVSDCDEFVDGWAAYAGSPWAGTLAIKKTKQGGSLKWHVSFDGARGSDGSINLVVQAVPTNEDTTTMLVFENARGLVSAGSSPGGGIIEPANNRCLDFCITASPE